MNIEEEIKLIGLIVSDLNQDRPAIIIKYVLPLLSDLIEFIPPYFFTFDNLVKIFPGCLGDVMNLLLIEHVACILQMNKLKLYSIEEFIKTDWEFFNDLSECDICGKLEILLRCEENHKDECVYAMIEKFCNKKICEECIGLNCEHADQCCNSIRCIGCYKID